MTGRFQLECQWLGSPTGRAELWFALSQNAFREIISPLKQVVAPEHFCTVENRTWLDTFSPGVRHMQGRYSSVVERALRKRTVVGSIPTVGCNLCIGIQI